MSNSGMRRRDFLRAASILGAAATTVGWEQAVGMAAIQQMPRTANRQFSLAYLTVFGVPPPEMTYIAARAGYDFVSLRPIYMGLPNEPNFDLSANPQLLRQTKSALASTGVRVHDVELARVADGTDPKKYLPQLEVGAELVGTNVSAQEVPLLVDELPLFALLAAHAHGDSRLRGAAELRAKETDRIEAVVEGLRRLGAHIRASEDGFVVRGVPARLRGGWMASHGDHRIAMLAAVAGITSREGVEIRDAEAAAVSFPGFYELLDSLRPTPSPR